jgi:hypothetical protein
MSDTQSKDNNDALKNMGYDLPETNDEAPVAKTPEEATIGTQEEINAFLKEAKVDDNGKIQYPADIDPKLKLAIAAEKKYRDTQAGYTKAQMSNKELEAENQALREQLANGSNVPLELTPEEAERLDDLKYTNPEEWHRELKAIEDRHLSQVKGKLSEQTEAVKKKASEAFEFERRSKVLKEFNKGREVPINDATVENDIPPRITNKLKEGKISFEEFLSEAAMYLDKGKTAPNPSDPSLPDLHKTAGGSKPSKMETEPEIDYSTLTL